MTLKRGQHAKYPPYAFTEHGAIMAANVLNSPEAVAMSVYVVRAFVQMREHLAANAAILKRLTEIDTATDFSVGWANTLTGGWYVRLLGPTGYIRYVDQTSTAFHAGEIVGTVHNFLLEVAMPTSCQVGVLVKVARNIQRARDLVAAGASIEKLITQGASPLTLGDWLALAAPVMSCRSSKCFTEGHRIVVLGDGDTLAMVDAEGREVRWAVGLLAVGGMLHLIRNRPLVEGSNQRRSRQKRIKWDEVMV